jgi:hypothetical protein
MTSAASKWGHSQIGIAIAGHADITGNEIHGQPHILLDLHGLIIHEGVPLAAVEHGEGRQ